MQFFKLKVPDLLLGPAAMAKWAVLGGVVGLLCGLTNCPMASLLLALELFGGSGMVLFALCAGLTYVLSGYGGLYSGQKILFSKFRPEAVDLTGRQPPEQ